MDDGGSAFPSAGLVTPDGIAFEGMTLRDYFAAKAIQGLVAHGGGYSDTWAENAYHIAEAMIKERNK